jgi:hypothetical protein
MHTGVIEVEAVVNDYISREIVQDAICSYLRSREGASQAGSRG